MPRFLSSQWACVSQLPSFSRRNRTHNSEQPITIRLRRKARETFLRTWNISTANFRTCIWLTEETISRQSLVVRQSFITAPFNNTRTLKFKAPPANAFFATVNQIFGGFSQLPTTAERAVIKSNRWAQLRQHSQKLGGAAEHLIDGSAKRICRLSFEF